MTFGEVRQAFRSLRRSRGLAGISIFTVALGVAASTSLFSVVKAVLLNPLPFPDSERLAWISESNGAGLELRVSMENFADWRAQNRSFTAMAAYGNGPMNAGGGQEPQRTRGAVVTLDFFDVLAVRPFMGRGFTSDEQTRRAPLTVILGHALWQRAYGGDAAIIGRTVRVVGQPATVIGIMPAAFSYPDGAELWLPWGVHQDGAGREHRNFRVIARLKPGVSFPQANADIAAIAHGLNRQYPGPFQAESASVVSLREHVGGDVRLPLQVLFAAVGFLLLIVCVNVANLLMVRLATRSHEIALRLALGAMWRHVVAQLLTESLMLAAAGGALGLLISAWSIELVRVLLPASVPRAAEVRMDPGVIAFAIGVSALTGVLFGLLPAWRAARLNLAASLRASSHAHTASKRSHRLQRALVVSEICLSLVLVAGAGLLLNSLFQLRSVDAGMRPDHVLSASMSFPNSPNLAGTYREMLGQVRAIPGVESAGAILDLPLDPVRRIGPFQVENRTDVPATAEAISQITSPDYFRTLGIPLLRGRDFAEADSEAAAPVAVISAEMARVYWLGRNPIGDRVRLSMFGLKSPWFTIVGIVGDVRQYSLAEPPLPQIYVNYAQAPQNAYLMRTSLVLRTPLDPVNLVPSVQSRIRAVDREAALSFQTLNAIVADSLGSQRFQARVLAGFACLALSLAAVGLYGVLSYMVNSNRVEIGIRIALGARPAELFGMVTLRAMRMAVAGVTLGLLGCLIFRRLISKLLFGIGPADPPTLIAASVVMLVVAFIASWRPARKAMRLDPVTVLRQE